MPNRCSTKTRRAAGSTTRCSRWTAACCSACTPTRARERDSADEERTGLDHISFAVGSTAELEQWASTLEELGIAHGGVKKAHYGSGVAFRDPDNVPLEFFAFPG